MKKIKLSLLKKVIYYLFLISILLKVSKIIPLALNGELNIKLFWTRMKKDLWAKEDLNTVMKIFSRLLKKNLIIDLII